MIQSQTRARYGFRIGYQFTEDKICRGPRHAPGGELLPKDAFGTRRAASGNIVPKPYCRDCTNQMQQQDRLANRINSPQLTKKRKPRAVKPRVPQTEKFCSFHRINEPVENFNFRNIDKKMYQPFCREGQKIQNDKRAKHPRTKKPIPTKIVRVQPTERLCADCSQIFTIRFRDNGTPKHTSYCHACKMERQRQSRIKVRFDNVNLDS